MVIKVKYNGEWVKIPYLSSDHGRELVDSDFIAYEQMQDDQIVNKYRYYLG